MNKEQIKIMIISILITILLYIMVGNRVEGISYNTLFMQGEYECEK